VSRRSLQFSRSSSRFVSRSRIAIMIHDSSLCSRRATRARVDRASQLEFTCVSVSIRDVATSNLFGLLRYLFCRNCFSNSRSCWDVNAVRGLLVLPSSACCAAQPAKSKAKSSSVRLANLTVDSGDSARMPRGWRNYPLALRNYDREAAKPPSLSHDSLSLHSLRISNR